MKRRTSIQGITRPGIMRDCCGPDPSADSDVREIPVIQRPELMLDAKALLEELR